MGCSTDVVEASPHSGLIKKILAENKQPLQHMDTGAEALRTTFTLLQTHNPDQHQEILEDAMATKKHHVNILLQDPELFPLVKKLHCFPHFAKNPHLGPAFWEMKSCGAVSFIFLADVRWICCHQD